MLAPLSAQAPYPSLPRKARKLIHSAAPPLKIAIALLDCDFVIFARRRNVDFCAAAAHTRRLGGKPHTVATRASRRGAGARYTRRVERADCFHGPKIGTIGTIGTLGTLEGNPPFAVAAVGIRQNPVSS